MNLLKKTVNLHLELLQARQGQRGAQQILENVSKLLEEIASRRLEIRENIASNLVQRENELHFDLLETDRLFHIDQIRKICIEYRLRFLPSGYFKPGIPEEAVSEIRKLEDLHGMTLGGFHIVAPSKAFLLQNVNDPLLFAPVGNGYFYLIHKWGNDLPAWRKIWVWPYRNLVTFTWMSLVLSFIVTWLTPTSELSRSIPMARVIIFLFAFKSIFAVGLYCFFMLGKKFNSTIWDSRYFN